MTEQHKTVPANTRSIGGCNKLANEFGRDALRFGTFSAKCWQAIAPQEFLEWGQRRKKAHAECANTGCSDKISPAVIHNGIIKVSNQLPVKCNLFKHLLLSGCANGGAETAYIRINVVF